MDAIYRRPLGGNLLDARSRLDVEVAERRIAGHQQGDRAAAGKAGLELGRLHVRAADECAVDRGVVAAALRDQHTDDQQWNQADRDDQRGELESPGHPRFPYRLAAG